MTPNEIRERDKAWKARVSATFEQDCAELFALYQQQTREVTMKFLAGLQLGNKNNRRPPAPSLVSRLVNQLATLYRTPPVRQWMRDGVALDDADPRVVAATAALTRAKWDPIATRTEQLRVLLRQVFVVFAEHERARQVVARLYGPHQIWRVPDEHAADRLELDHAICLPKVISSDDTASRYEVWRAEREGGWRVSIEDGRGRRVGSQPYVDTDGWTDTLPIVAWYDDEPAGEAWLAPSQARLDTLQTVIALVCDLQHLTELETASLKVFYGFKATEMDPLVGPGKAIVTQNANAKVDVLEHKPQIGAGVDVVDFLLSLMALSEGLAPDAFARDAQPKTGPAFEAANALIDANRKRQLPLAIEFEASAWRTFSALHNRHAARWGVPELVADATLQVAFGSPHVPIDPKTEQDVWFRDLQAGLGSPFDYLQQRHGMNRSQALHLRPRIEHDRALMGWTEHAQPPGAVVDGAPAALGAGSATIDRSATNLDPQSNNEQASVVGALQ